MKNQKMKKIIFEATTLMIGTMILLTNVQALTTNPVEIEYENSEEGKKIPYNYKLIGMGHIDEILIDGEYSAKGTIKGDLSISNQKSATWVGYCLYIIDKVDSKILTKWTLPKHFELKNFTGNGEIYYYSAPHGPDWTEFFLIGTSDELICK